MEPRRALLESRLQPPLLDRLKFRRTRTAKSSTYGGLLSIPGVGKSIAQDLIDLSVNRVAQLKNRNPENLYQNLLQMRGTHIDRCVQHVFRCAVYFASHPRHDPERLKGWNWKG